MHHPGFAIIYYLVQIVSILLVVRMVYLVWLIAAPSWRVYRMIGMTPKLRFLWPLFVRWVVEAGITFMILATLKFLFGAPSWLPWPK
jgi:hypothetical protein